MKILSLDKQKGFTLIEVIATIVIAGVVGAMTFSFFGQFYFDPVDQKTKGGSSFLESTKTVSNLNKALGLQAVVENINQDYTRNYAGSDTALSSLKTKIGSVNSTYNNKYGSYKVAYNDFIKFSSTGGTESSSTCGMCAKDLLKVTIQQTDTKETLTALFSSGGASGSGGCGGGGGGGCMGVSVSINPKTVTIAPSVTQQFTATVSGTTNTSVTWSATGGTVDSNDLYTAPSTAGTYYVTATSVADTTKSATATVTVTTGSVMVSVSTTYSKIRPNCTTQITATVSGTTNTSVTWSATGGTLSSTSSNPTTFTAPTTTGTYSVTATSVADSTKSATVNIMVGTGGMYSCP